MAQLRMANYALEPSARNRRWRTAAQRETLGGSWGCRNRRRRWHNPWGVTPTVLRTGPYRFFFFASDKQEPPHVHVEREAKRAKFWLEPVEIEGNSGFGARELARIIAIVEEHRAELLKAWHDFFSDK